MREGVRGMRGREGDGGVRGCCLCLMRLVAEHYQSNAAQLGT